MARMPCGLYTVQRPFGIVYRTGQTGPQNHGLGVFNPWGQQMQDYRAYLLGPDGRIKNRIDLVCENDEAAKRQAKQLVDGHDVELWQLGRKIGMFKRN